MEKQREIKKKKKYEQTEINPNKRNGAVMIGWVCPVCGRGNSPFTFTCPCKPMEYKITYGDPPFGTQTIC